MTSVQVLEWVSRVTPLGVQFLDMATCKTVDHDLSAIVYPVDERELWTGGVVNRAGIYVFRSIFGLHAFETGYNDDTGDYAGTSSFWSAISPPNRYAFTLEVRDLARRFVPFVLPITLPQRGLFGIAFNSPPASPICGVRPFVPLFSAPSRTTPEGMTALRAEMVDSGASPLGQRAAAWAVVEAKAGDQPMVTGVADERGVLMLPLPYPKPVITLGSMATGNVPLQDQTWTVTLTVRYRRRTTPLPDLPNLYDVLSQPVATAWQTTAMTTSFTQTTLAFGREIFLETQGTSDRKLLITPP